MGDDVVGLIVGTGAGMALNASFGSIKKEESKFPIFGHTLSKSLSGTPNHVAIVLKTASL